MATTNQQAQAALVGGSTASVADVSRQLAQISKSLAAFSDSQKSQRNANLLADAVVVPGECPSGLIGCNAAELYEKTGGELNCPPIEMAPDPLIVDHKGRVCYAPSDIRDQFKGKTLNITDLMEKYALKLVKMLQNGQNLATAIEVANKGPAGNPIVMNAYVNSPRIRAACQSILGAQDTATVAAVAAMLSKFSDKLAPDTGAELVNLVINEQVAGAGGNGPLDLPAAIGGAPRFLGRGQGFVAAGSAHQQLTNVIVAAAIAFSNDQGKATRFAKLLNSLGYVLQPNKDTVIQTVADAQNMAMNAISFLPKGFRDSLSLIDSVTQLYRFILVSLAVALGEVLAPSRVPEAYARSIEGLKVAFTEMRAKRDAVIQYAQRKERGELGNLPVTAAEDAQVLEAKKGADLMYVARVVDFGKVIASRLGVKFERPLAAYQPTDSENLFEKAMAAAEEISKGLQLAPVAPPAPAFPQRNGNQPPAPAFGLLDAGAGNRDRGMAFFLASIYPLYGIIGPGGIVGAAAGLPGARYGGFLAIAVDYSKMRTTQINIQEDPLISAATLGSVQPGKPGQLAAIQAQDTAILQVGTQAAPSVCKTTIRGKPFFLADDGYAAYQNAGDKAAADGLVTVLKAAFNGGNGAALGALLNNAANVRALQAIVGNRCEPISDPREGSARVYKQLNMANAVDQLFANNTASATGGFLASTPNDRAFGPEGLPANYRDAYIRMLIVLNAIGDPQSVASLLLSVGGGNGAYNAFAGALYQAPAGKKVSTGMRLGGGAEVDEFGFRIEGGEEEIGGGVAQYTLPDMEPDQAADFLLNGGAVPAHQMPKHVHDFLDKQVGGSGSKKEAELKKKLREAGYEITTVYTGSKCPSYARDSNNTFGAPGHKEWVSTNSAWPKCMEQMGVQFVSEEGYCYPYGMSCYSEDDLTTVSKKTIAKAENWMEMARIYNTVQQKRYEDWLEKEKARIRLDPINAGLPETEVEKLAKEHIPDEFRGVPDRVAVTSLSIVASELAASVNEFTTSNEPAIKAKLREVLRTGYRRGEWEDEDKYVEAQRLEKLSDSIFREVKKCTDAAIDEDKRNPNIQYTQMSPGYASWAPECEVKKFPDADSPTGEKATLIPKSINAAIDTVALEKGEPPEPIVEFWADYYGKRILEKRKKELELAEKISPFAVSKDALPKIADIEPAARDTSPNAILTKSLRVALDSSGRRILKNKA